MYLGKRASDATSSKESILRGNQAHREKVQAAEIGCCRRDRSQRRSKLAAAEAEEGRRERRAAGMSWRY